MEPLGLAVTTRTATILHGHGGYDAQEDESEDDIDYVLPASGVPFVLVMCDAASSTFRPCGTSQLRTYPCVEARCMDPAAFGCMHCGKHGGREAKRCVEKVS